jgi:hypothetical protein
MVVFLAGCIRQDNPGMGGNMPEKLALSPPMGWNSFDCFGAAVTEDEVRANAGYMAKRLKPHGWEYVVVDFCWSHPAPGSQSNPNQGDGFSPPLAMDGYGRLLPAPERFPSAAGGRGFGPLADYVHGLGLRFGIHIMRGISRQAAARNTPVPGASVSAAEIADQKSTCNWLNHMCGVDMSKPGAQAYYDSLFKLYAEWGVDYVKADDMLAGSEGTYHAAEIEAVRIAAGKCGRPMVLSFSPGAAPLDQADHLKKNTNMWRISGDFWDNWGALKSQFDLCRDWAAHTGPGHWPDADMLPLGKLSKRGPEGPERWTNFTRDEQVTMMTLWFIFRSPLMMGGNMPENDEFTLSLLTNDEALAVSRDSANNRELFRRGDGIGWVADVPGSAGKYVALFNLGDAGRVPPKGVDRLVPGARERGGGGGPQKVAVSFGELGLGEKCRVRDLWKRSDLGGFSGLFVPVIPPHGAGLYRIVVESK